MRDPFFVSVLTQTSRSRGSGEKRVFPLNHNRQLCVICLCVGQHSLWPLPLHCSTDASFRDGHGQQEDATTVAGGAD